MSEPTTTNIPGWYTDPETAGQLRLWDGHQWTRDVRPEPGTDPEPAELAPVEPGRRERSYATFILGVLIVGFALGGFYEVVSGNSSSNSNPNRFATPTTNGAAAPAPAAGGTQTAAAPAVSSCQAHPQRSDARKSLTWLASEGIPDTALPTQPAAPATSPTGAAGTQSPLPLACSHVSFHDARDAAVNDLWVYPTERVASRVAQADTTPATVTFASGYYVLRLGSKLAAQRPAYTSALAALAAQEAPPTTTTPPAPVVPGGP